MLEERGFVWVSKNYDEDMQSDTITQGGWIGEDIVYAAHTHMQFNQ